MRLPSNGIEHGGFWRYSSQHVKCCVFVVSMRFVELSLRVTSIMTFVLQESRFETAPGMSRRLLESVAPADPCAVALEALKCQEIRSLHSTKVRYIPVYLFEAFPCHWACLLL